MQDKVDILRLLDEMTLDEKIGQLTQLVPSFFMSDKKGEITGPLKELSLREEDLWRIGSVLGTDNAKDMLDIQKKFMEKQPHHIPLLFMADVIHGFRTVFPVPLAMGCTWDTDSAKLSARIAAKEAALSGIHVTFSPMVDLVRDPRWGRVVESTGEDPYLNSLFGKAFIEGYQGDMTEDYDIAACVKHFAAYGAPEGGREYNTVDMSERTLREYYLPSYKAAVEAGSELVMTSFNTVHGIPSTANSYLMRDILRKEWAFDGIIISDWAAIEELIAHGVAKDGKEAARKAIEAGVDIEMMSSNYINYLKELVEEGTVKEELIDEAVLRILKLKEKMGLFENPYGAADQNKAEEAYLCNEHRKSARKIAAQSMVLLKNENVLPLSKNQKVALIGPFSDSKDILGPWTVQGKLEEAVSLYQGIVKEIGTENILHARGCEITGKDESGFVSALEVAKASDSVIIAIGEDKLMSGEAGSRAFINIPGVQEKLVEEILALKKPTVVVLFNGRPLEMTHLSEIAPAILEAWFPGSEGGNAIADIIFGNVNPSARLTMSFPDTVGQIPVYYNSYNTGRPKSAGAKDNRYLSQYLDIPNEPLYPFGYGLSYTTFEYGSIAIDKTTMTQNETISASITVKNTGKITGIETVQLYIRDIAGSTVRPLKELKGFRRVTLKPGEEKAVQFEITADMLKFHDFKCNFYAEPGCFMAMIGHDSSDTKAVRFELIDESCAE